MTGEEGEEDLEPWRCEVIQWGVEWDGGGERKRRKRCVEVQHCFKLRQNLK
jgi:hypothetical protein